MRRWLCCACNLDESHHADEIQTLKSPKNYLDGMLSLIYAVHLNFFCRKICYLLFSVLFYMTAVGEFNLTRWRMSKISKLDENIILRGMPLSSIS